MKNFLLTIRLLALIILGFVGTTESPAQSWVPLQSLEGGASMNVVRNIFSTVQQERGGLMRIDTRVFSHGGRRLYVSLDSGRSWVYSGKGLPAGPYELCRQGQSIFASVCSNDKGGLFRSTDMGSTWSAVSEKGLAGFSGIRSVYDIAATDSSVFVLLRDNVDTRGKLVLCRSTNEGDSWESVDIGNIPLNLADYELTPRPLLIASRTTLVASFTGFGFSVSTDNGGSFNTFNNQNGFGIPDFTTRPLLHGHYLYAVSNSSILKLFRFDVNNYSAPPVRISLASADAYVTGLTTGSSGVLARVYIPSAPISTSLQWWHFTDSDTVGYLVKSGRGGNDDMLHMPLVLDSMRYLIASDRAIYRSDDKALNFGISQSGYRNFGSDFSFIAHAGNAVCVSDYEHLGFYSSLDTGATWETDFYALDRHPFKKLSELYSSAFATDAGLLNFDSVTINRSYDGSRSWLAVDLGPVPTLQLERLVPLDYHNGITTFRTAPALISSMSIRYFTLNAKDSIEEWMINIPNRPSDFQLLHRGNRVLSVDPQHSIQYSQDTGASWSILVPDDTSLSVSYSSGAVAAVTEAGGELFVRCSINKKDSVISGYPLCHVRDGKLHVLTELLPYTTEVNFTDILNFRNAVFSVGDTIFIALGTRLFESHDHAQHFQIYGSSGLPSGLPIMSLTQYGKRRFALVDGGGIYVQELPSGVDEPKNDEKASALLLFPQPATDVLRVVSTSQLRSFEVHTMHGVVVLSADCNSGNEFTCDLSALPAGAYSIVARDTQSMRHQSLFIKVDR